MIEAYLRANEMFVDYDEVHVFLEILYTDSFKIMWPQIEKIEIDFASMSFKIDFASMCRLKLKKCIHLT